MKAVKKYVPPPPRSPDQENQALATVRNSRWNNYYFNCCPSAKINLLNLVNLLDLLDLLDLLYILETYLLQNELIRQRKQEGGEQFENRGFSCKSNYKVKCLLNKLCFLLVCEVILHLALCWKHDLKN